jgi:hypothetical protein
MKPLTLQEELIKDFQEQKKSIAEQLEIINPMATSLRKPAAQRILNSSLIVAMEVLVWLLVLGVVAFVIFIDKLFPFYLMDQLVYDAEALGKYKQTDLKSLYWGIKGLAIIISVLLIVIGRMLSKIRIKNSILNLTGKSMKQWAEQLLKRKANMETLNQRFSIDLPMDDDTIILPNPHQGHNDVLL